jgi:hypothetical protein
MADGNGAYRALAVFVALLGVAATVFGFGGLYVVLTGGTTDSAPDTDVLGEYDCTTFDGDPEVEHDAAYEVERTLVGGSEVEAFDASSNETSLRIELAVAGEMLDASASRADGATVPVRRPDDGNRLVIAGVDPAPLRIWVDSLSNESAVTRTQLDVCPPE